MLIRFLQINYSWNLRMHKIISFGKQSKIYCFFVHILLLYFKVFNNLLFSVMVFGWALAGLEFNLALFSLMVALSTVFCRLKPVWWLLVWDTGTWGWGPVLNVSPIRIQIIDLAWTSWFACEETHQSCITYLWCHLKVKKVTIKKLY